MKGVAVKIQGKLSRKQVLFCQAYTALGNINEAASLAGYTIKTAYRLLLDDDIQMMCKTLSGQKIYTKSQAVAGLSRLAFGDVNDALLLLLNLEEAEGEDFKSLDLFCVSKIKVSSKGDIEFTFHDRQKALLALLEHAEKEKESSEDGSFYNALKQSAHNLNLLDGEDAEI